MELQKKATKLKLKDIPGALSPFRLKFIDGLTTSDIYKNTIKSGIPGFSEEELCAIEKRYEKQGGLLQSDIQNELKNKGWQVRQNTIKHYLKVGQLPKPTESRGEKTSRGAFSLYPINFMRHLNFVRFMLNAGRNLCGDILNSSDISLPSSSLNDYVLLEMCSEDGCVFDYLEGFIYKAIDEGVGPAHRAILLANILAHERRVKVFTKAYALAHPQETVNIAPILDDDEINDLRRRTFEGMKLQALAESGLNTNDLENSDKLNNVILLRLKKYLEILEEIETSLKDLEKKTQSLRSETKSALWTIC